METHEKIRLVRELNKWSQEEVAEKLDMSPSGYAKIERGESVPNIERLEQIANIFQIDIWELIKTHDKGLTLQISGSGNSSESGNISFYNSSDAAALEIEKLKLQLKHAEEMLQQKEKEIALLRDLADSLKHRSA